VFLLPKLIFLGFNSDHRSRSPSWSEQRFFLPVLRDVVRCSCGGFCGVNAEASDGHAREGILERDLVKTGALAAAATARADVGSRRSCGDLVVVHVTNGPSACAPSQPTLMEQAWGPAASNERTSLFSFPFALFSLSREIKEPQFLCFFHRYAYSIFWNNVILIFLRNIIQT
jgi:hypothetical protein